MSGASSHFQIKLILWKFHEISWFSFENQSFPPQYTVLFCKDFIGFQWKTMKFHEIFTKSWFFWKWEETPPKNFWYIVWTTPLATADSLPMSFRPDSPILVTCYAPPFDFLRNFMVWTEVPPRAAPRSEKVIWPISHPTTVELYLWGINFEKCSSPPPPATRYRSPTREPFARPGFILEPNLLSRSRKRATSRNRLWVRAALRPEGRALRREPLRNVQAARRPRR